MSHASGKLRQEFLLAPISRRPMTAEHFKTLQAYHHRRPFRSFSARFVSGAQIAIDHPKALIIRAGVGVYVSAACVPTLVIGETKRRKA